MNKLMTCILAAFTALSSNAISIVRYVAEGANGDGLTKETPAGNLKKVLDLSTNVESLTIFLEPGRYVLPTLDDVNLRKKYNNISIYGGGGSEENVDETPEKSIIEGDLYISGGCILNVDFRATTYGDPRTPESIDGSLHVIGCNVFFTKANRFVAQAVKGQTMGLIGVEAQSADIYCHHYGMGMAQVIASGCNFSNGTGASISGVKLLATDCLFNNNSNSPGLVLGVEDGSIVRNCQIVGNKGKGGVVINGLTDNINTIFDRCVISKNITKTPNFSAAITTQTPFLMRSCLLANNFSFISEDGMGYEGDHWRGAVLLTRRQSQFQNCTFYKNGPALLHYKMEPSDHQRITAPQFTNCVFLGNESPYLSKTGHKPFIAYSATDFGSDIPELDAENHIMRITPESSGMIVEDNTVIHLLPDSPLINAGIPVVDLDINGNSHRLLGGTDLGCVEYTGDWSVCQPEVTVKAEYSSFFKVKTYYKTKSYYGFVNTSWIKDGMTDNFKYMIYGGTGTPTPKVYDEEAAVSYLHIEGKKYGVLMTYEHDPWYKYGVWSVASFKEYNQWPPTAEKTNGKWILKEGKPQTTTTSRKPGTQSNRPTSRTNSTKR